MLVHKTIIILFLLNTFCFAQKQIYKIEYPNVRFGIFEPTTLPTDQENDTYIRTSNGLFSGTFIEEYVFDKTSLSWILVTPIISSSTITNSIYSSGNILTSDVSGETDTTTIINSNVLSYNASNTTLTSTINGVTDTAFITMGAGGATTNTLSISGNVMTSNVNSITDTSLIIGTNIVNLAGNQITSNINGVTDTTLVIGTLNGNLSGNSITLNTNGVTDTVLVIGTNNISYSGNILTSTVNGVTDTALISTSSSSTLAPIRIGWDGQGGTVSTGSTRYYICPYACTITGWSIVATGTSPKTTIDIWRVATGTSLPTVANTIMGTKPALSTGNAVRSTTLTSWSPTSLSAGDILGFNIDALANALTLVFTLEIQ